MSRPAIADVGFVDPHAARAAVRRLKLRAALTQLRRLAEASLKALDQGFYAPGDAQIAALDRGVGLAGGNKDRGVDCGAINHADCQQMAEQELLDGLDLVMQLFQLLLNGLAHGQFSSGADNAAAEQRIARRDVAHRLSQGDK